MTPMDNMDSGLFADLPNPGAATKDKFFYASDTGQLFVSDGDAWIETGASLPGWDLLASLRSNGYNSPAATVGATPGPGNTPGVASSALDQPSGFNVVLDNSAGTTIMDVVAFAFVTSLQISEPGGGLSVSGERIAVLGISGDVGQARTLRPSIPEHVTPTPGPFAPVLDGGMMSDSYTVAPGQTRTLSMNDLVYVASPDAPGPIIVSPVSTFSTLTVLTKQRP